MIVVSLGKMMVVFHVDQIWLTSGLFEMDVLYFDGEFVDGAGHTVEERVLTISIIEDKWITRLITC